MSFDIIREQIKYFISEPSAGVMAIKGEWGVGKTYGWESILLEAKEEKKISAKKYSYVSLFGISSLDKLKYSIFENSISLDLIGSEPSLESFKKNTKGMLESFGRSSLGKIKEIPFVKSAVPAVEAFSFMSVSGSLLCIDDLERKGATLDLKDVLGLVSLLKERKKCKVVLLLNAGTKETEDYEKFKEKVIDVELEFSPTPKECALIAFNNDKPWHEELSGVTTSLGIKNIRLLHKIDRCINLAYNLFDGVELELKNKMIKTIALFCWSYYCSAHDENVPSMEFIELMGERRSSNSFSFIDKDLKDDNLKAKENHWKNVLLSYNFTKIDAFSRMIAKLVKRGYIEHDEFKSVIVEENNRILINNDINSYQNAWDDFYFSFVDEQKDVVEKMNKAFIKNIYQASPADLDNIVSVFIDFDEKDLASNLVDLFIKERESESDYLFDPVGFPLIMEVDDGQIIAKFEAAYNPQRITETIKDVLERISGKNGWSNNDIEILSSSTEEDFYKYFKSLKGSNFTSHISTCLKFGGTVGGSMQMDLIHSKARTALIKISDESKINKRRVAKFGI